LTRQHLAGCGHLDIVKLLVEAGADKNAPNADKQTPAALAKDIKEGNWQDVVSFLDS
jgi:ankyrin repeat protein